MDSERGALSLAALCGTRVSTNMAEILSCKLRLLDEGIGSDVERREHAAEVWWDGGRDGGVEGVQPGPQDARVHLRDEQGHPARPNG